jgi:basic membrane protein A
MYRTRRTFALVLLVVLTASLIGVAPTVAQEEECEYRIGFVTDVGRLNDQSFNESAWMGIQEAAEALGLGEECYNYIETQDTADYIPNIELFIEEGYDIIVTSGYLIGTDTRAAGLAHPEILFIGTDQDQVDENYEYDPIDNVAGLLFDESVSGFLAGALAGMMTESNVVAGVYGTDVVPPVVRFRLGYELGAAYVNPDITVLGAYHPGTPDIAFADAEWGGETAQAMMDEGADVVFGAGGTTGNGALIAACNARLPVIGVDIDQYYTVPEVEDCIMSSATKGLVNGVRDLVIAAGEGAFVGGSHLGGAVLAPFHEWEDKIPDEVKERLEEITELIAAGEIQTCPIDDPDIGWNCAIAGLIPPLEEEGEEAEEE